MVPVYMRDWLHRKEYDKSNSFVIKIFQFSIKCPLVFGCWELSLGIFLMLRKKELLAKLSKIKMVLGFD